MLLKAKELKEEHGYFEPQQFENLANPEIHELTTGPELVDQFEGKQIDAFLAGVGTGGTLSGVGKVLRKEYLMLKSLRLNQKLHQY